MKYLKKYNEISSYLNLHGDDPADITQVKRNDLHDYDLLNKYHKKYT